MAYFVRECGISHAYRQKKFRISKSFVWQPYRAIDYAVAIMLSLPRYRYIAAIHFMGNMLIVCLLVAGLTTLMLDYFTALLWHLFDLFYVGVSRKSDGSEVATA